MPVIIDDIDNEIEKDPNGSLIDSVPKKYTLIDNFWETIEETLPKKSSELMRFIAKYREVNITKLETPYPIDYPVWSPACVRILYECSGIEEDELYKYTSNIEGVNSYVDPYLKKKDGVNAKLMQFAMFLIYRYYRIHEMKKEMTIMKYYMGYYSYTMAFNVFFKRFKPNEAAMKYTINSLSYKNFIKKLGSVHKWIYYAVDSICNTYDERIIRGSDAELLYVIDRLRLKFTDFMRNLYSKHKQIVDNKEYMFSSEIMLEDGSQRQVNSRSNEIAEISDRLVSSFFMHPISDKCIRYATNKGSKSGSIPEKDLRNTIFLIADDAKNKPDVTEFTQALLTLFFTNTPNVTANDIRSKKFIVEMQKIYKPGNSVDKNRVVIKDIIDKWLLAGSATYRNTNRAATISIFRKSIYDYFIYKYATD